MDAIASELEKLCCDERAFHSKRAHAYHLALQVLPPLHPIWQEMATMACVARGMYEDVAWIVGNAPMTANEFAMGMHVVSYTQSLRWRGYHEERRWYDARCAGVLFAVYAHCMTPTFNLYAAIIIHQDAPPVRIHLGNKELNREKHVRRMLRRSCLGDAWTDYDVECIVAHGISNCDWSLVQSLACEWLTKRRAAIVIQRAWRTAVSNPDYAVCKCRLSREFEGLSR